MFEVAVPSYYQMKHNATQIYQQLKTPR